MKTGLIGVLIVASFCLLGCKKAPVAPSTGGPLTEVNDPRGYDDSDSGLSDPAMTDEPISVGGDGPITAGSDSYTIRKGDTLWSIALRVYGNGQRWQDIAAMNGINNPARLPIGKTLVLP